MTLGQFLKMKCDLSMDNNVTFLIVEIITKMYIYGILKCHFLVHCSLQLPLSTMCQHLFNLKLDDFK